MSLGYFSPGQWVFGIRVKNGSTVVYEGFSDITSISSNTTVDVLVNKLVPEAAIGSVRISVTAPSALNDELTVSYENEAGTVTGSETITATSASDKYLFEHTFAGLDPGTYTFTFVHSSGNIEDDIEVVLPADEMAVISGYLYNRAWHLGYNTLEVYSISVTCIGSGNVQANVTTAAVGDRVSLYVKPFNSSALESLVITCGGQNVSRTDNGNLYSFIMPSGNVAVTATFEAVDAEIDINNFKTIVHAMYDDNVGVTAFGRSAVAPVGKEYLGIKDVLIWYDDVNSKICWYSDNGTNTLKFKAGSMAEFFREQTKYTSIDLTGIDTSAVTNMSHMFYGCTGLTEVVLDSEKVTEPGDPRYGKFLHFNTANVTDMSYMFSSTDLTGSDPANKKMNIESLDVSGFDTSSVTNMSHMFFLCSNSNLTTLDVSHFNTSNVTDMSSMFGCWKNAPSFVTAFNLSGWDFSKVTTVNRMFDRCENAVISFPGHTKLSRIEDMLYLFSHCFRLTRAGLQTIIASWDFSEHNNTTALSALFSNINDFDSETSPNNRIIGNDMRYSKHHIVGGADFDTRVTCSTHTNNSLITTLYVGGDISTFKYQRLTTVETP